MSDELNEHEVEKFRRMLKAEEAERLRRAQEKARLLTRLVRSRNPADLAISMARVERQSKL